MRHDDDLIMIVNTTGRMATMRLSGELVARTRHDVEATLRDCQQADVACVAVQCGGLKSIDSAGLATLMGPLPRLRRAGGDIVLAEVSPQLRALFDVQTLQHYFKVFPTIDEAQGYLATLHPEPLPKLETNEK